MTMGNRSSSSSSSSSNRQQANNNNNNNKKSKNSNKSNATNRPQQPLNNSQDTNRYACLNSLDELRDAIVTAAARKRLKTLCNALRIFMPNSLLDKYVDFLRSVFARHVEDGSGGDEEETTLIVSKRLLAEYKREALSLTTSNKNANAAAASAQQLEWFEDVIEKITRITILSCYSLADLSRFGELLANDANETHVIRLIKLVACMLRANVSLDCSELVDKDNDSYRIGYLLVDELCKRERYADAVELAESCKLGTERIHLAYFSRQLELLRAQQKVHNIVEFWTNSSDKFAKAGISDQQYCEFMNV